MRVSGQQFFTDGLFGFIANTTGPFFDLLWTGAGFIHQFLPLQTNRTGLTQEPAALHQVVGLQHELALFEQGGLKLLNLVQKRDQVQRNAAQQFEFGPNAGQFGIGRVPDVDEFVFEINLQLAAQEFA